MGHSEKDCLNVSEELQNQGNGWGVWLKASPMRGKKLENEEIQELHAAKKLVFVPRKITKGDDGHGMSREMVEAGLEEGGVREGNYDEDYTKEGVIGCGVEHTELGVLDKMGGEEQFLATARDGGRQVLRDAREGNDGAGEAAWGRNEEIAWGKMGWNDQTKEKGELGNGEEVQVSALGEVGDKQIAGREEFGDQIVGSYESGSGVWASWSMPTDTRMEKGRKECIEGLERGMANEVRVAPFNIGVGNGTPIPTTRQKRKNNLVKQAVMSKSDMSIGGEVGRKRKGRNNLDEFDGLVIGETKKQKGDDVESMEIEIDKKVAEFGVDQLREQQ